MIGCVALSACKLCARHITLERGLVQSIATLNLPCVRTVHALSSLFFPNTLSLHPQLGMLDPTAMKFVSLQNRLNGVMKIWMKGKLNIKTKLNIKIKIKNINKLN